MNIKRKRQSRDALVTLMDFGFNPDTREIFIGDIEEFTIEMYVSAFKYLEFKSKDPITLIVSSYGGDLYNAFALVDLITNSKCEVYTVSLGKNMSAGTLVSMVGSKRTAYPRTRFMLHEVSAFSSGRFSDMKAEHKETETLMKEVLDMYELYTNKDSKFWRDKFIQGNFYISAKEALELGLIDSIIGETND